MRKGLKYVPIPTSVNKTELIRDIKQMGPSNALKEYFWDEDKTNIEQPSNSPYNKPSKWTPCSGRDQALDCYNNAMEHAILQHTPNSKLGSNVTRLEREAIKTLKRDKNIVIFQTDKGTAVAVKNRKDHLIEAHKQLNGTDENGEKVYFHIPTDPTSDFVMRVKDMLSKRPIPKGVINTTTADYLVMIMPNQWWLDTVRKA